MDTTKKVPAVSVTTEALPETCQPADIMLEMGSRVRELTGGHLSLNGNKESGLRFSINGADPMLFKANRAAIEEILGVSVVCVESVLKTVIKGETPSF